MNSRSRVPLVLMFLTLMAVWGCAKGVGKAVCGDGTCTPGYEDLASCPEDCTPAPECGNGACEPGENAVNCLADCDPAVLCGNGTVDLGEHCDGADLDGMTCAGLGSGTGTLLCSDSCRFDLSACTGGCVDQCSGEVYSRCLGNVIQECVRGINGCYVWQDATDCAALEQVCDDADGSPGCQDSCTDVCTNAAARCLGNLVQVCATGGNGCLQWTDVTDCSAQSRVCEFADGSASCVVPCTDACPTVGDDMCLGDVRQECRLGTSGCREWQQAEDCAAAGKYCSGGECLCAHQCETGQTRCNGTVIQSCSVNGSGCRVWSNGTDCASSGQVCNASSGTAVCATACTNACSSGQTQCSGSILQTCQLQGTGCWAYVDNSDCASQGKLCSAGACVCDNQCTSGERACMMIHYAYECVQDANGCWDWGNEDFCMLYGDICFLGYCVTP